MARRIYLLFTVAWLQAACEKVPITDIAARFPLAEAAWFAEEETLFVFYRVEAEQGLGSTSQVEISFRSDSGTVPFTPVASLTPVHEHVAVDCGANVRCGSASVRLSEPPRQVALRLRYHSEGEVFLPARTRLNIVGPGPPHQSRSLIVYGVFDATNTRIEWRARHQFPNLRNQEAQELGLRRSFRVEGRAHGTLAEAAADNPYGYGIAGGCAGDLSAFDGANISTSSRAMLDPAVLPAEAAAAPVVCATATVTDGKGVFAAAAIAQKNPEVRAAFPALRSPIRQNRVLGYLLRQCARAISDAHRAMQVQRLALAGQPEICIDDWAAPGFAESLASQFRARIDEERVRGVDMVLSLALHHDDTSGGLAAAVERALSLLLPFERDKSSPRLSGAFVFDTFGHTIARAELRQLVLWCPSTTGGSIEDIPAALERGCPLLPDLPMLTFGVLSAGALPILPSRAQYLRFLDTYSEAQAGRMLELAFFSPERTPLSRNVSLGDFGVATFFNNEAISAAADDVFSYCPTDDSRANAVVFSLPGEATPLPLSELPALHAEAPQAAYGLGLAWDFPFLARLRYEATVAGAVSAFSLSVPFGISRTDRAYYGAELWSTDAFALARTLLQCSRFCNHPTFDSAGVYNVNARFDETYKTRCYEPLYPAPERHDPFPLDP